MKKEDIFQAIFKLHGTCTGDIFGLINQIWSQESKFKQILYCLVLPKKSVT